MPEASAAHVTVMPRRDGWPFNLHVTALGVALFGGALAVTYPIFGDLFPMIEYRQWLNVPLGSASLRGILVQMFSPDSPFSRTVPMATAVLLNDQICHFDMRCNNLLHLILLAASGLFAFLLVGRLTRWRWPMLTFLGALLFFLSEPMLGALTWQATLFDKAAVFATTASLLAWTSILRMKDGPAKVATSNIVMLVLMVLTYNCKEAAWAALPSAILLHVVDQLGATGRLGPASVVAAGLQSIKLLALPIGYVVYHTSFALWNLAIDGTYMEHAFGGAAHRNLASFLGILLYWPKLSPIVAIILIALAGLLCAALVRRARTPEQLRLSLLTGWAYLSFLFSLAIPLRTGGVFAFYLLAPGSFLFIFVTLLAMTISDAIPRAVRLAPTLAIVLLVGHYARQALVHYDRDYAHVARRSANLWKTLETVRTEVPETSTESINFVYPAAGAAQFVFLGPSERGRFWGPAINRGFHAYLYGRNATDEEAFDRRVSDTPYDGDPETAFKPNAYNVVLDKELALVRAVHTGSAR